MSVLTATRSAVFTRQLSLPFAASARPATQAEAMPPRTERTPRNWLRQAAGVASLGTRLSLVPSKSAQADLEPRHSAPLGGSAEGATGGGQ